MLPAISKLLKPSGNQRRRRDADAIGLECVRIPVAGSRLGCALLCKTVDVRGRSAMQPTATTTGAVCGPAASSIQLVTRALGCCGCCCCCRKLLSRRHTMHFAAALAIETMASNKTHSESLWQLAKQQRLTACVAREFYISPRRLVREWQNH